MAVREKNDVAAANIARGRRRWNLDKMLTNAVQMLPRFMMALTTALLR